MGINKKDPHQLKATRRPVFDNQHNPGQRTTLHRDVETVRLDVARNGPHPEKGQFRPEPQDFPPFPPPGASLAQIKAHEKAVDKFMRTENFRAPSGARVATERIPPDPERVPFPQPHDTTVNVNGQKLHKGAARQLLHDRFGIGI